MQEHEIYSGNGFEEDYYGGGSGHGALPPVVLANLNAASIPKPPKVVKDVIDELVRQEQQDTLTAQRCERLAIAGRQGVAQLLGARDDEVILGLNATEVFSMLRWLVGLFGHIPGKRTFVTTDAECPSTYRSAEWICTEGNTKGRDRFSTFSDAVLALGDKADKIQPRRTEVEIRILRVRGRTNEHILSDLQALAMECSPCCSVFSQVLRGSGRFLDTRAMTRVMKDAHPENGVIIDWAQALGNNVSPLNLHDIGCDGAFAATGKGMQGPPLGIGAFNAESSIVQRWLEYYRKRPIPSQLQVIRQDMLQPSSELKPNSLGTVSYPDIGGFIATERWLRLNSNLSHNGGFDPLYAKRQSWRERSLELLRSEFRSSAMKVIELKSMTDPQWQSPFILALRLGTSVEDARRPDHWLTEKFPTLSILGLPAGFGGMVSRGQRIVRKLEQRGVYLAYLGKDDGVLRVSFPVTTMEHHLQTFAKKLHAVVQEELAM